MKLIRFLSTLAAGVEHVAVAYVMSVTQAMLERKKRHWGMREVCVRIQHPLLGS